MSRHNSLLTDDEKAALDAILLDDVILAIHKKRDHFAYVTEERNAAHARWSEMAKRAEHIDDEIEHLKARLQVEL